MWLKEVKDRLGAILPRSRHPGHDEEHARHELDEASKCLKDAKRRADTLQLIVRGMRNKNQWYTN